MAGALYGILRHIYVLNY